MQENKAYRNEQKTLMYIDRGGFGVALCDNCKGIHYGLQMHELIARSITEKNEEARNLSFQRELCCLLDPTCHDWADTTEVQDRLWDCNRRLYGEQRFWEAFDRVQGVMRTPIPTYGKERTYFRTDSE